MKEAFVLESPAGDAIRGLLSSPDAATAYPTIVMCHGFKGFYEWGFHPYLAELLVERRYTVVQFNFHGAGMKPGDERVTDPEAFRSATFSRDLDELVAVLGALGNSLGAGRVDRGRVGLFGHSRGGGLVALAATEVPGIRALVTWNGVGTFARFDDAAKAHWRRQGAIDIVNGRTGQTLPMGVEVLEDFEAHAARLDIESAALRSPIPWLIVHGQQDETVPVAESRHLLALTRAAAPRETEPREVELLEIEGAGHTLGAQHPFQGPTPHLIQAMNATQSWFRRYL